MGKIQQFIPFSLSLGLLLILLFVLARPGYAQEPSLEMVKTVSDDGSCGTTDAITVTWNTSVTYCYSATNTGTITLTTHTLTDTVLISILDNFPYVLAPKATFFVTATFDPPDAGGLLKNCALWTARDDFGTSIQADDCATIFILTPTDVSLTSMDTVNRPGIWKPVMLIAAICLAVLWWRRT